VATISSNLSQPTGIAIDSSGNLYVSNGGRNGNNTISEFNSAGSFLTSIGSSSNLDHPFGIAIDSSGDLYVDNYGNGTVSEFTNSSAVPEPSSVLGGFTAAVLGLVLRWRKRSSTPLK